MRVDMMMQHGEAVLCVVESVPFLPPAGCAAGWSASVPGALIRWQVRDSIVASIPACHAGDQGSIPCHGISFCFCQLLRHFGELWTTQKRIGKR
ncbi:hypothetical protein THAOC_04120 [Thalassiosira oceanica]|uniref:Uncharacterized protein n=1 Tax=Thalassiosira oceanica TaxID=159749 RepID=K0TAW1_THAOC|nr:hypothetical protein THAOC_04120 [Thalassiosira oceanica]|eukprot:EJK74214.1 hypothetical protein THAOC_04120 [Thalassiosira oceanica]